MSRNCRPDGDRPSAGKAGQDQEARAADSFDFDVVTRRRHQQAAGIHKAKGEASDAADRRRAAWDDPCR